PKQVDVARRDIERLLSEVDKFTLDNGGRPPESLDVLVLPDAEGRRFMDEYRARHVDSWGRPFVYFLPTPGQPRRIVSYGRDGKPGGTGLDADIDSATLENDG
ncbi:MAG: type II secretion system protein GspG, partial [Planctomycetota bacterium]|nr:type II secretion system protein GspG [Planctomycetota bacterium]